MTGGRGTPPLIDAHHHLWRAADLLPHGILASPYLRRDFLWPDLERSWEGLDVRSTVAVQARDDEGEVGFVEEIAARHPGLAAMVAWAPLEREDVRSRLEALSERSIVRGVRRNTQGEPDPAFIRRPAFGAGARALGELGLVCELCVRDDQVASVPPMARECPETLVVVDHIGKPDVSGSPPPGWLRAMEELGRLSNVFVKLSPVVHTDADRPLEAETQAPFLRHVVECLGWDRVLFGSNWPVSLAVTGYRAWAEIVTAVLSPSDESLLQALFADNAARLFGIGPRSTRPF